MRKLVCIVLSLCSAAMMACNDEDPLPAEKGRMVAPRLSNARWDTCCRDAPIRESCKDATNREEALALLIEAHGAKCLDQALAGIRRFSPEDLSAAYFIRGQRLKDPVDFLRSLQAAEETLRRNPRSEVALFNRALVQEKLGLTKVAIASWDEVRKYERSDWSEEAGGHIALLQQVPDPIGEWNPDEFIAALEKRDRPGLTRMAQAFPAEAARQFERKAVFDLEAARLLANVLASSYADAIVDAMEQPQDPALLEQGLQAWSEAATEEQYARAADLLERAKNPLYLSARFQVVVARFRNNKDSLALLNAMELPGRKYPEFISRVHTMRAGVLEQQNYLAAHKDYTLALAYAKNNKQKIDALGRRSANYERIGDMTGALNDSVTSLSLLRTVADLNARHHAYATAATVVAKLGFPHTALHYQNAAVADMQKAVLDEGADPADAKRQLRVALRQRADIHARLGNIPAAELDLKQAASLAEATDQPGERDLLNMRIEEIRGQVALHQGRAREAEVNFSRAIELAQEQDSTYRAVLHYKRALALQHLRDRRAEQDIAKALDILHQEATILLDERKLGDYEDLWSAYFARFQEMYQTMVRSRIAEGDVEGAFLHAEQARAFEPLHILLRSRKPPQGFRKLVTVADLRQQLEELPSDTVILHYLVLGDRTFVWRLQRDGIRLFPLNVEKSDVERWVDGVRTAVAGGQRDPFNQAMRAAYDGLFATPLRDVAATRLVIVPDGPMHALPFAGLQGTKQEGYLIDRYSIAVDGSTSLYFHALARDRQFEDARPPTVLIAGDPAFTPVEGYGRLQHARQEAELLAREYAGATLLLGRDATIERFLGAAGTIIHFAGHGVANPQNPSRSMLLLAPQGRDSGQLTAQRLMTELSRLERTRLIILAACSTAGGQPVGPEGIAPLVRPLIAANVPGVAGSLWQVDDATVRDLMVSLHRHYRNGDDVAVALQKAQREMLRNNVSALWWAPFQVVGHAGSPYARPQRIGENVNELDSRQDPLHRPDGLHSQ